MRVTVRVPATSANLGPGFDCFGLAFDLCNEVTADTDGEPGAVWEGEGEGELATDGSDMVSRSIVHVMAELDRPAPPIGLRGVNRIPLERGLGSSSSATVAGVALGLRLAAAAAEPPDVFAFAAQLEGHPDNAAAACWGGFTIAVPGLMPRRITPHPDLRPVLLVPGDVRLPTAMARAALPDTVGRADAIFNVGHAALMVEALREHPSLLLEAMRDRLHEEARLAMIPEVREVVQMIRAAGVPVCVSGAGPTLLAFAPPGTTVPDPGGAWRILEPAVRATGFEFVPD